MNICVYCSSSDQVCDEFKQQATEFGKWLAQNEHTLVYGGATGGLMSAVAEGAAEVGGDIVGIMPEPITYKRFFCVSLNISFFPDKRNCKTFKLTQTFKCLLAYFYYRIWNNQISNTQTTIKAMG